MASLEKSFSSFYYLCTNWQQYNLIYSCGSPDAEFIELKRAKGFRLVFGMHKLQRLHKLHP